MAEQWIEASKALELAGSTHALCERANAGLVKSRARLLLIGNDRHENAVIPSTFWWADGREALDQDWATGDFSTWIDRSVEWKAFGVRFALPGVLELLPSDRRGVVAHSLSVSSNPDWVSANEARRFAYEQGKLNPTLAGPAIIQQAQLGFVTARAVLAQASKGGQSETHWSWEWREWDVATWYWEKFTESASSSQNWELGKFSGRGIAPDGARYLTLTGVHFLRESLNVLLPAARSIATAQPVAKNQGGRPPAAFADDLMCAIWGLIHQGDLKPKSQADIERAMLDWAARNDHELGLTAARGKARRVFAILTGEVENPSI
jgi:hypothetical protein